MRKVCETLVAILLAFGPLPAFGQSMSAKTSSLKEDSRGRRGAIPTKRNALVFHARDARYRLQCQDVLSISFALSPEFDQKAVTVEPDGYIALNGTHNLYVRDLTVPETEQAAKNAYAGILHDPIIVVDLIDFQRPVFTVLGQVSKPGMYDLRRDITITEAVATAGGLNAGAKTQLLLLRRVAPAWSEVKNLNLKQILHGKNISEDVHVQPGDILFIPEKAITMLRKYLPYGLSANPSSWAGSL